MSIEDDDFFPDDDPVAAPVPAEKGWPMLIVDDEPGIHQVTRLALSSLSFQGRPLEFLSAHSGQEALEMLQARPDIALMLLDVVMETEDAGLKTARAIREDLRNNHVRIILRTGQPGQAPEREVIDTYDINDYKGKTELTREKLYTCIISSLRNYKDLMTIERSRVGLEKIVAGCSYLFQEKRLAQFASGVLDQLNSLLELQADQVLCTERYERDQPAGDGLRVVAASQPYLGEVGKPVQELTQQALRARILAAVASGQSDFAGPGLILVSQTPQNHRIAIFLDTQRALDDTQRRLVEVFITNLSIAMDNIQLLQELNKSHESVVVALADLAEAKDNDTAEHVLRVSRVTRQLAHQLSQAGAYAGELNWDFEEQVGLASVLHDVGKVGVPDKILLKPGRLEPDERVVMEHHAPAGGEILDRAARRTGYRSVALRLAALIANGHHEKFDGSGYPLGLKGDQIPLPARIVAVADVVDALLSKRPYKEPWPLEKVLDLVRSESGKHFDPAVVEAFFKIHEQGGLHQVYANVS